MIHLATTLVNEFEAKYSQQDPEKSIDFMQKLKECLENDDFLETIFFSIVFDAASHLARAEWQEKVLEGVQWIFDSNKLRSYIYEKVRLFSQK